MTESKKLVAVIMGSRSDWEIMANAEAALERFGVHHVCRVLSAHRTLPQLTAFLEECERDGVEVFIAGAGGAAHLPGVIAAHTTRPVLGVPMPTQLMGGMDSLLSIVQMPAGIPVACLAVGKAGATNAALLAVSILATSRPELAAKLSDYRREMAEKIQEERLP